MKSINGKAKSDIVYDLIMDRVGRALQETLKEYGGEDSARDIETALVLHIQGGLQDGTPPPVSRNTIGKIAKNEGLIPNIGLRKVLRIMEYLDMNFHDLNMDDLLLQDIDSMYVPLQDGFCGSLSDSSVPKMRNYLDRIRKSRMLEFEAYGSIRTSKILSTIRKKVEENVLDASEVLRRLDGVFEDMSQDQLLPLTKWTYMIPKKVRLPQYLNHLLRKQVDLDYDELFTSRLALVDASSTEPVVIKGMESHMENIIKDLLFPNSRQEQGSFFYNFVHGVSESLIAFPLLKYRFFDSDLQKNVNSRKLIDLIKQESEDMNVSESYSVMDWEAVEKDSVFRERMQKSINSKTADADERAYFIESVMSVEERSNDAPRHKYPSSRDNHIHNRLKQEFGFWNEVPSLIMDTLSEVEKDNLFDHLTKNFNITELILDLVKPKNDQMNAINRDAVAKHHTMKFSDVLEKELKVRCSTEYVSIGEYKKVLKKNIRDFVEFVDRIDPITFTNNNMSYLIETKSLFYQRIQDYLGQIVSGLNNSLNHLPFLDISTLSVDLIVNWLEEGTMNAALFEKEIFLNVFFDFKAVDSSEMESWMLKGLGFKDLVNMVQKAYFVAEIFDAILNRRLSEDILRSDTEDHGINLKDYLLIEQLVKMFYARYLIKIPLRVSTRKVSCVLSEYNHMGLESLCELIG